MRPHRPRCGIRLSASPNADMNGANARVERSRIGASSDGSAKYRLKTSLPSAVVSASRSSDGDGWLSNSSPASSTPRATSRTAACSTRNVRDTYDTGIARASTVRNRQKSPT